MTTSSLWQGAARHAPAGNPASAIILLHGLGSNAEDLIALAPLLAPVLPRTLFISPNAPWPCDMAPSGYQWFSLQEPGADSRWAGVQQAAPYLAQFVREVAAASALPLGRIVLMGFSQGCMMALHVALRLEEPVAGVVGLSGALIGPEHLEREIRSRPPILLAHGQMDPVVPYGAMAVAETVLQRNNVPVETVTSPQMQHNIDDIVLTATAQFLLKILGEG